MKSTVGIQFSNNVLFFASTPFSHYVSEKKKLDYTTIKICLNQELLFSCLFLFVSIRFINDDKFS